MKIYHATSMKNACRIFSKKTWALPDLKPIVKEHGGFVTKERLKETEENHGISFTPHLSMALAYARQYHFPVIIECEAEEIEGIGGNAFECCIYYHQPLKKFKAMSEIPFKDMNSSEAITFIQICGNGALIENARAGKEGHPTIKDLAEKINSFGYDKKWK